VESKARIKERLSPWPLTPLDVTQRTPRTPRTAFLSLNTYFDHRSRRTPTRRVAKMMKTQSSINASSMKKSIGRTKPSAAAAVAAANPNLGEMPPLHGACHRGSSAEVKQLLEAGEDVNEHSKSGMTPLMCVCKTIGPKEGDDQLLELLLDGNADPNAVDIMGDTALHVASASLDPKNPLLPSGFDKLVAKLVERGANVNALNKLGQSALHRAAQRGNLTVVKLLLEGGADASFIDRSGRRAEDVAFDDRIREALAPPPPPEEEEEEEERLPSAKKKK